VGLDNKLGLPVMNVGKVVNRALAPSESLFPKLAGTEKSPSEQDISIISKDLLWMVDGAKFLVGTTL
jgi:hypothetical protein